MTASYVLSGMLAGILEGAILYVLDWHFGARLYRWWHGLTHQSALPSDTRMGFIYNRKANARFTLATLVSLAQNGLLLWTGFAPNPFLAMLTIILEVPVLMIGFYLGPFVHRLWQRKDPLLDVVDKLESGETTVGAEVKRVTARVAGTLRGPAEDAVSVADSDAPAPTDTPPAATPEPDPESALRDYTRRQQ